MRETRSKKRREGTGREEEPKEFSSCPQKCSWEIVFIMFGDEFSPKAFCVCWQTFPTASAADFVHTGQLFTIIQFITKIKKNENEYLLVFEMKMAKLIKVRKFQNGKMENIAQNMNEKFENSALNT